MSFVKAVCTRYDNQLNADGTPRAIYLGGIMHDNEIPEQTRYAEYCIEGAEFDALPAADPSTDGTPADPRFQAIMGILAREVKLMHAAWVAEAAARIPVVPRPTEQIEALPPLTALPPD